MKIIVFALCLVTVTAARTPCRGVDTDNILSKFSATLGNGIKKFLNLHRNSCVFYQLYTQNHTGASTIVTSANELEQTSFDPNDLNVFLIHGSGQNRNTKEIKKIALASLENHRANIFVVDWSTFSVNLYPFVQNDIKYVGVLLADFINEIQINYNLTGSPFLLIGYELGAHVAGLAGSSANNKIDRIVGLDPNPAGRLDERNHLNPSQADYVDVIQTSSETPTKVGNADFYPNGGSVQNGCRRFKFFNDRICSGIRALEYFAESVTKSEFQAVECSNYEDFLRGFCQNNTISLMGGLIKKERPVGSFYLETGKFPPYATIDAETRSKSLEEKVNELDDWFGK